MRRFYSTLAVAALFVLSGAVMAHAATSHAAQAAKAGTSTQAQAKAATIEPSMMGTIEKWDETSKMLTIKTAKGTESEFTLGANCTIAEGTKSLTPNDLSTMVGQRVRVYHTRASSGTTMMTADRIVIEQPRTAKTSKMATSTSTSRPKK